jgi:hypothetical protein
MARRTAILLIALWAFSTLGIAVAHGASKTDEWPSLRSAGSFMLDDIRYKTDGKWSLAWQTLYPAHKSIATRGEYVACEEQTPWAAPVQSFEVVGVKRASFRIPGGGIVDGAAVAVRIGVGGFSPRDPLTFVHSFHLVPVNGHWTWLLSPQRYTLYRGDGCGRFPAA